MLIGVLFRLCCVQNGASGGTPTNWRQPFTPCFGTCPGPHCRNGTAGLPVQDPVQIRRRNIDYMAPILDWVKPVRHSSTLNSFKILFDPFPRMSQLYGTTQRAV